jgi:hypothetical protein
MPDVVRDQKAVSTDDLLLPSTRGADAAAGLRARATAEDSAPRPSIPLLPKLHAAFRSPTGDDQEKPNSGGRTTTTVAAQRAKTGR